MASIGEFKGENHCCPKRAQRRASLMEKTCWWSLRLLGRYSLEIFGRLTDGLEQRRQWCRRCCGKERAEPEGKALNLQVNLRPNPHLLSWALGSDRKNKIANTSGRNELPSQFQEPAALLESSERGWREKCGICLHTWIGHKLKIKLIWFRIKRWYCI